MKDKFYPHAILVHPSVSDEAVWSMIFDAQARSCSKEPVLLILEPSEPFATPKGGESMPNTWLVNGKPVGPTYH